MQLWRISQREGRLGLVGVDLRGWIRCSIEIPEALAVVRVFYSFNFTFYEAIERGVEGDEIR